MSFLQKLFPPKKEPPPTEEQILQQIIAGQDYSVCAQPAQLHGDGGSRGDFFEGENGHKMNAVGLR